MRHLLTIHENSIPLSLLPTVYLSEFHRPEDPDIYNWLSSPLHHAPHVIHYAAEDVIVWAPTGRPYPLRGGQSLEAPEYLKADIEELGSVPEELASRYQNMVEDPLPSISLEFLDPETVGQLLSEKGMEGFSLAGGMEGIHGVNDSELNQFLVLGDVDTGITREEEEEALNGEEKAFGSEEEDKGEKRLEDESVEIIKVDTVNHVHEVTSNTVPTSTISDAAGPNNSYSTLSSDEYPPTTTTACAVAPSIDDVHARPPSQGLDHGQFAGLLPQDVAELMRESLSAVPEDDVQGKVKTMSPFFDYFGELSAREMERVDGPPKQRTRRKQKQKLAICFPTSSTTDHPQLLPQSSLPHALFENGEECEPIPQQK